MASKGLETDVDTLKMALWGKDVELGIDFDVMPDEAPYDEQRAILQSLVENWSVVEDSKGSVESYCSSTDPEHSTYFETHDINDYVIPKTIWVKHRPSSKTIALLCEYRFDLEDGLAVVFEDCTFEEVCAQDEVV